MGGMKISELDFLRLLPAFMRDDEAVRALSRAMDKLLGDPGKRLDAISTWGSIGDLSEAECDELAWELDIDWYDSTGMSLQEKRDTIRLAQQIKRKRGTKWAVERLVTAYLGEGYVLEWYELEGYAPYTFIALTTNPSITAENYRQFVEAVKAAKNERSHIAGVFFFWEQGPEAGVEYGLGTSLHRYQYTACGTRHRPAILGAAIRAGAETEPEATGHLYGFAQAGENACGAYPQAAAVAANMRLAAASELRAAYAGYKYPECGAEGVKATQGAAIVGTAIVGRAIIRD